MISKRVRRMLASRVKYPYAKAYGPRVAKAINLASNESPYGPSPRVIEVLKREVEQASKYPDPQAKALREEIAKYVGVKPENITLGNGSDELLDLSCKLFLDQGEKAVIPIPSFSMYEIACWSNGGRPKYFKLPNFSWPEEGLVRALGRARLAILGRPNNPTGNGASLDSLKQLLALGKPVVVDEAYAEFAGYSVANLAARTENLLVLRTFSKAFGLAGLRIGYAVGVPELIQALEQIRPPFSVNSLAQAAALAALKDRKHLREVVGSIQAERERLRRELAELGFKVLPSDANFLMVGLSSFRVSSSTLCDFLAKRGILVRDLSSFRGVGNTWIRVSIGTPAQNEKLLTALRRFKKEVVK